MTGIKGDYDEIPETSEVDPSFLLALKETIKTARREVWAIVAITLFVYAIFQTVLQYRAANHERPLPERFQIVGSGAELLKVEKWKDETEKILPFAIKFQQENMGLIYQISRKNIKYQRDKRFKSRTTDDCWQTFKKIYENPAINTFFVKLLKSESLHLQLTGFKVVEKSYDYDSKTRKFTMMTVSHVYNTHPARRLGDFVPKLKVVLNVLPVKLSDNPESEGQEQGYVLSLSAMDNPWSVFNEK